MNEIHPTEDATWVRFRAFLRWPNTAPLLLGIVMVSAIAVFDWATAPEASGSLLYVIAVVSVTWCGRLRNGVLVAMLATVESLAAHVAAAGWSLSWVAAWNAASRLVVLIVVATLLAKLRTALQHERHLAAIDPLTGALNRRAFQITAERERLRASRTGTATSLLYMDLDHFKAFNDRFGHRVGDRLLTTFSDAVAATVRATDVFARIGGDEFVVLLPDTDVRAALTVAERVRRACARSPEAGRVTASMGIATFPYPPTTVDEMVDAADAQMYRAKDAGGDRIAGTVVPAPSLRWADRSLHPDDTVLVRRATG